MRTFRMTVIASLALGCETWKQHELRIDNVVRVFMHEPDRYTLFTQEPEAQELTVHEFTKIYRREIWDSLDRVFVRCGVYLRIDVPRGEPMWATSERWFVEGNLHDCILTIHLHDPTEVDGGGWNHGKFGRGTTQVVE